MSALSAGDVFARRGGQPRDRLRLAARRTMARVAILIATVACLDIGVANAQQHTGSLTIQTTAPAATLSVPLTGNATTTVASQLPTTFIGSTPANNGPATVTVGGAGACGAVHCGFAQSAFAPLATTLTPPQSGFAYPHGLFSAVIGECAAGAPVQLTYTFSAPLPVGTTYLHYGPTAGDRTPHWHPLPAVIGTNTITVTLGDGGAGDDDLAGNGVIALRGAAVVAVAAPPSAPVIIPAIGSHALVALGLLLLALGLWSVRRRLGTRMLLIGMLSLAGAAAWWTHGVVSAVAQGANPITASPPSLTFAAQDLGRISAPSRILVRNATNAPVNLGTISIQGDFEQVNDCPPTLDVAQMCSVDVRFVTTACTGTPPPPPPTLTSAAPPSLIANGAAQPLVLTGKDFVAGAVVLAGATTLAPTSVNATTINVTMPATLTATAGTLTLRVRNPDQQQSNALDVPVVAPPPILTSATPPSLIVNAQSQPLTLAGQNFVSGAVVLIGATSLTPTAVTATSIDVTVPGAMTATAGTLTLRVRNPDLQQSGPLDVPVVPPGGLLLTQLTPNTLPAYHFPHLVNLVGSGFDAGAVGVVAGVTLTPVSGDSTQLLVEVPASLLAKEATLPTFVRNSDGKTSNTLPLAVTASPPDGVPGPEPLSIKILDPTDGASKPLSIIPVSGTHVNAQRIVVGLSCTPAQITGNTFLATGVPLAYGDNLITATAYGKAGAVAIDRVTVHTNVPSIAIDPKLMGAEVDDDSILVSGTYQGPAGAAVTVNGVRAMVAGSSFTALIPLSFGPNNVQATIVTPDAKTATASTTITDTLPSLEITAPAVGLQVAQDTIDVSGTYVGTSSTPISVNGVAATKSNGTFTAKAIPLVHARNLLKATAISPTGRTVSRAVMVMNTQPSLTITSPADGATIGAISVAVKGVVTARQGPNREQATVTVNGVVATRSGNRGPWVPDPPFGNFPYGDGARYLIQDYTATVPLVAGANTIVATVNAPNGQSLSRQITVIRPDTVIALTSPADGTLTYDDNVIVYGRIDGTATNVTANGIVAVRNGNVFAVRVPLVVGPNVINVVATTAGGPVPLTLNVTRGSLAVAFVRPQQGEVIDDTVAQVRGTFTGPADVSVIVNGIVAMTINGTFFANNVPLKPGSNTLTATVVTNGAKTATTSVSVTRSMAGLAPMSIVVDPGEGIAPHVVRVYVMNNSGSPITQIDVDTNENGVGSQILSFPPTPVFQLSYPDPGIFRLHAVVSTKDGHAYDLRQVIRVRTVAEVDAELRGIFNDMLTRLRARDINGAMNSITGSANARYYAIFNSLSLPSVVDQLGTLVGGTISRDVAEYSLVRQTNNGPRAFLIYFLRGEDGVWRIDSM